MHVPYPEGNGDLQADDGALLADEWHLLGAGDDLLAESALARPPLVHGYVLPHVDGDLLDAGVQPSPWPKFRRELVALAKHAHAWMSVLRERKACVRARSGEAAAEQKLRRLSGGWNRVGPPEGDKADVGLKCEERQHGNRLITAGFVRVVRRSIGRREWAARHGDALSTTHAQECMSLLAAMAEEAQASAILECVTETLASRQVLGKVVTRGHDASPVLMRFGSLQQEPEPEARYLIKVATVLGGQ